MTGLRKEAVKVPGPRGHDHPDAPISELAAELVNNPFMKLRVLAILSALNGKAQQAGVDREDFIAEHGAGAFSKIEHVAGVKEALRYIADQYSLHDEDGNPDLDALCYHFDVIFKLPEEPSAQPACPFIPQSQPLSKAA